MNVEEFNKIIEDMPCVDLYETGSKFICNPPVTDTDEDWIVDCSFENQYYDAAVYLETQGFKRSNMDCDDYDDIRENFTSYRKGDINLILCNKKPFYKKFVLATLIAKELNLLEKEHRISLFQAMLYGRYEGEDML